MGKRKAELKITGMDELMRKYENMSKGSLEPAISEGLKDVQDYLNGRLENTFIDAKLPAKGKYATGETKESIVKDHDVIKSNNTLSIKLGFDLKKSGLTSIYLMCGTPRMSPAKGLHACFNGAKSRREAKEIFDKKVQAEINKIMNS